MGTERQLPNVILVGVIQLLCREVGDGDAATTSRRGRIQQQPDCSETETCVSTSEHMFYNRNMRFRRPLDDVFRTATRVKILRLLTRTPDMVFTGREIARHIGVANSNVTMALSRLEKIGILHSMVKGRSLLYSLNTQHVLCERLLSVLYDREASSLNYVLDKLFARWPDEIRTVICYGSVARGEEKTTSDVDLCFVTRDSSRRGSILRMLEKAQGEFYLRTGNPFSPYVVSAFNFAVRYLKDDLLIRKIASEGLLLRGDPISELVK
jgi:predicted nucleotidyltransferase